MNTTETKSKARSAGRVRRWRKIALVLLIVVLAVVYYARRVEPNWIEITRYNVVLTGLPKGLDGLKIVQLSDLHRRTPGSDVRIRRAVDIAQAEHPDLVALTGDFVSVTSANARPCARILSALKPRLGMYAVLGNHDYWHGSKGVVSALSAEGITLLTNANRQIAPGLYLVGLDDSWAGHPDAVKAWQGVDEGCAQVVLAHNPGTVSRFQEHRCLALTGHTHGGEVDVKLVSRSKLPGLLGFKYIKGWYHVGKVDMYVNRGIGIVNPFRARLICRPEVTVFTLRSPAGGPAKRKS